MSPTRKQIWIDGLYTIGRDYGHDLVNDDPTVDQVVLEAEIYNYLMQDKVNHKYQSLIERVAARAVERVWYVHTKINAKQPEWLREAVRS